MQNEIQKTQLPSIGALILCFIQFVATTNGICRSRRTQG